VTPGDLYSRARVVCTGVEWYLHCTYAWYPQKDRCEVCSSRTLSRSAERSWAETRSLSAVFAHAMGCRRTQHRFSLPGHSLPRILGLGNRCTQLPDDAPRGNRPPEATTKIVSAGFQGEQTTPTHWHFEPSCHLAGSAKTGGVLIGRPACTRPLKAGPSSGEGGL
jgi:hypothetical protein